MRKIERFIIGMWNPSVVLTYIGLCTAVMGMVFSYGGAHLRCGFICLMLAGICDLFDGAVARRIRRRDAEKQFGIHLDSLVDVVDFIGLPIAIFVGLGMRGVLDGILFMIYAICGIARLGYFNVITADEHSPIRSYTGLPVTYAALIFPLVYLLGLGIGGNASRALFRGAVPAVSLLYILRIPVPKPRGMAYVCLALLAIVLIVVFFMVP